MGSAAWPPGRPSSPFRTSEQVAAELPVLRAAAVPLADDGRRGRVQSGDAGQPKDAGVDVRWQTAGWCQAMCVARQPRGSASVNRPDSNSGLPFSSRSMTRSRPARLILGSQESLKFAHDFGG